MSSYANHVKRSHRNHQVVHQRPKNNSTKVSKMTFIERIKEKYLSRNKEGEK